MNRAGIQEEDSGDRGRYRSGGHAHLLTASKIFCGCATAFGAVLNTQVCEVCWYARYLLVLNQQPVEVALKMALATDRRVNPSRCSPWKMFDPICRKGYQISEYAARGTRTLASRSKARRLIGIILFHMEEDWWQRSTASSGR